MSEDTRDTGTAGANGEQARQSEKAPDYPKLARFQRYFHRPVAVQLTEPMMMFDFLGGEMDIEGKRYGLVMPAIVEEDGKRIPMGRVYFLTQVLLEPSPDGEYLIGLILSPQTGAIIEVSIPPENIQYVTCIGRMPSTLIQAPSASDN